MEVRKLTTEEFKATQFSPLRVESGTPPIDFWQYVEAIPAEDFGIADCREGSVTHVYRMGDDYEHVLVNSQYQGLAMVIVGDLKAGKVFGHYLLDLNPAGTKEPQADA